MTLTADQRETLIDAANDRIEQLADQIATEVYLTKEDRNHLRRALDELVTARNALRAERDEEPEVFTEYEAALDAEAASR